MLGAQMEPLLLSEDYVCTAHAERERGGRGGPGGLYRRLVACTPPAKVIGPLRSSVISNYIVETIIKILIFTRRSNLPLYLPYTPKSGFSFFRPILLIVLLGQLRHHALSFHGGHAARRHLSNPPHHPHTSKGR